MASFGAADAAGAAAFATSMAMAQALAAVPKLATGTNYVPNDMLAVIHKGEAVVPAADNRDIIGVLQNGSTGNGGKAHVEVHNHGSNRVEVQHMDDDRVRLIVHAEGRAIVAKHADSVIGPAITNPNSATSKSITRQTNTTRRR